MKFTRRAIAPATIGKQLLLSFGSVIAITLLITSLALNNVYALRAILDRVVYTIEVKQTLATKINTAVSELISVERNMNLKAGKQDSAATETYGRDYLADTEKASKFLQEMSPLLETLEGRQLCVHIQDEITQLRLFHDQSYRQILEGDTGSAASTYQDQFFPLADQTRGQSVRLVQLQRELIEQESLTARVAAAKAMRITLFMLLLFFVVGGVIFRIITRTNRSLRQIAADLGQGASRIADAAVQVSSSSQSLAQGAAEQAVFIEQTSTTVEEIAAMARRNTRNAQTTAGMVAGSQRYIIEGNQTLDQMVAAMDGITVSSTQSSRIVKVIDQIAFQTNILALNAAAEAARAGEAGHSFAVVADEIRDLSQRSAQAAQDTAQLIEDCIAKSQTGKLQVDGVAAAIRSITNESAKINLLVDEIHRGSREQSRGIDQVSKAILQMEQVTQSTADGAEQSAAAAGQLNTQFQTLKEIARGLAAMLGTAIADESKTAPPARIQRGRAAKDARHTAAHEAKSAAELQPL